MIERILWDMDGVLVNFDHAIEAMGFTREEIETDKAKKSAFWKTVKINHNRGGLLWEAAPAMPGALDLWRWAWVVAPMYGVKEIAILSSTGTLEFAATEKLNWISQHLPHAAEVQVNFVKNSADKAIFANEQSLLIDDRIVCIEPFVAAGGKAILFQDAAQTKMAIIEVLKRVNGNVTGA